MLIYIGLLRWPPLSPHRSQERGSLSSQGYLYHSVRPSSGLSHNGRRERGTARQVPKSGGPCNILQGGGVVKGLTFSHDCAVFRSSAYSSEVCPYFAFYSLEGILEASSPDSIVVSIT